MGEKKAPPLVDKACKVCGAVFQVSKYRVKYKNTCSHACRVQASANGHATGVTLVTRPCPVCSVVFSVEKGQEANKQYCTSACGHKARAEMLMRRVEKTCTICGAGFECIQSKSGTKTCSKECANKSQRLAWESGVGLGSPSTAAAVALRRAKKKNAVPAWYDKQKVLAVYEQADRMRREQGAVVHVDHIVPLASDTVAGLHWHGNLQIINGGDNQSKGNKSWPDMP